jgi:hypothetical protein
MLFDVLYTNGRFHTQDEQRPLAHSLGVHEGRVISLDDELSAKYFRDVQDLAGATVLPGFNDAHCHLTYVGEAAIQVDLRPSACSTIDELLAAVEWACAQAPQGEWVQGAGYDQNYLDNRHPSADEIDAVSHGHPVWLVHNSRHMGVANTAAFERAGYPGRRGASAPEGGAVPTDADNRAEGLLQETARTLITDHIPALTVDDVVDMIDVGSQQAIELGLTSITEPGLGAPQHIGKTPYDIAAYQNARDQGKQRVRATVMPYLTTLHTLGGDDADQRFYGLDLGLRTGLGDDWLRIGPAKILSDGSLIGRSACMCCDYAVEPGNRGMLQFPRKEMRERIIGAHRAGWQVATHAIGDAALDAVMDIFEEAQREHPREDVRHRIEHLSVASDAQIARVEAAGVLAVPQGRFIYELGDGTARSLGPERVRLAYRIKGLLDAGLTVPASTDAPVVALDPILNIHDMVNRKTASGADFVPEERISLADAVRAYTMGSAYAVHEEKHKGKLTHGMLADFVTLSEDIHEVDVERIREVRVTATVIGGERVYGSL